MPRYVLLLHETPADYTAMTPKEMQDLVARYSAWSQAMRRKGHVKDGIKLTDDGGRRLARQGGRIVATDGPYSEAKEVVGGLYVMEAADDAEAEAVTRDCPHLHSGERNWVELRRIDEM